MDNVLWLSVLMLLIYELLLELMLYKHINVDSKENKLTECISVIQFKVVSLVCHLK